MRYIDSNGAHGEIGVGSPVCGVGFYSVELTYEDVSDPMFMAWFVEVVYCRFINPPKVKSLVFIEGVDHV